MAPDSAQGVHPMIEFKADCGHTVRARDEEAGGVVRCSYCGRNAAVPVAAPDSLDYLFANVEQPPEEEDPRRRRRARAKREVASRPSKPGEFNPFAVILRLCYAAGLIVIMVVVARWFVMPLFDDQKRAARMAGVSPAALPTPAKESEASIRPRIRGPGLLRDTRLTGLYVASTPPGAMVFCIDESKAPAVGRIHQLPGCLTAKTPGEFSQLPDGTYVVEVALTWNDPHLCDPQLNNSRNYTEFRRKIEKGSAEQRKQLIDEYFLPDEASAAFVDQTEDQIYLVRQHRGVTVKGGSGKGVRALFLPKLVAEDRSRYLIEPLVKGYIPETKNYAFDENHVRGELAYYGVAETDQPFVLEALARVGVLPYATSDRRVRMFKIDVHDGVFSTRVIREAP